MRTLSFPLMVFAAGFGTRMRELTKATPKPLLKVGTRSLLDRALDLGRAVSAAPIVVNGHYLAAQIASHLSDQPDVVYSDESAKILETGGGLRQALPLLGTGAVMTLNPDVVWNGPNPLDMLRKAWDPARMDALLLVKSRTNLPGRKGGADFALDAQGQLQRDPSPEGVVYLGAQIVKTDGLKMIEEDVFSLNRLWDQYLMKSRVYGLVYPGQWCDVGSPEGLVEANDMLQGA